MRNTTFFDKTSKKLVKIYEKITKTIDEIGKMYYN